MISLQHYIFWRQTLVSTLIFVPTLTVIAVLINFYPWWAYDPHIILTNEEFNMVITVMIVMGLVSLIFSGFLSKLEVIDQGECKSEAMDFDDVDGNPNGDKQNPTCSNYPISSKSRKRLLAIGYVILVLITLIAVSTLIGWRGRRTAYIYYSNDNETTIIQVCIFYLSTDDSHFCFPHFHSVSNIVLYIQAMIINTNDIGKNTHEGTIKFVSACWNSVKIISSLRRSNRNNDETPRYNSNNGLGKISYFN